MAPSHRMPVPSGITLWVSSSLFLFCILTITLSADTNYLFDRPVHSAVFSCFIAGVSLLGLAKFAPYIFDHNLSPENIDTIYLPEVTKQPLSWSYPTGFAFANGNGGAKDFRDYKRWVLPFAVCVLLSIRVELFRQAVLNDQCASAKYEYAIPLLISIFDYIRILWKSCSHFETPRRIAISKTGYPIINGSVLYLVSAAILTLAGIASSSIIINRRSTYICPTFNHGAFHTQIVKLASISLDTLFLIGAAEVVHRKQGKDWAKSTLQFSGTVLLGVVALWVLVGIAAYPIQSEYRRYLVFATLKYYHVVLFQAVLLTLLFITFLIILPRFGLLDLSLFVSFLVLGLTLTRSMIVEIPPFIQISISTVTFIFFALTVASSLFLSASAIFEVESKFTQTMKLWSFKMLLVLCAGGLLSMLILKSQSQILPIDVLIRDGKSRHDLYLTQAKVSQDLEGAILEYKRRYKQYPPPGFDKWYEFATSRNSQFIDDFDQIFSNLLPFRAISPRNLRQLTHRIATNPSSDVGAIRIRNGSARNQEGIKPTHAWMINAAVHMINGFAEHLPDMDILLNLNDEPRIAVPYDVMSDLRILAEPIGLTESPITNNWSENRDSEWDPIEPADMTRGTLFTDYAISNIWDIANQICPPSSKSRSTRAWSHHDLCLDCLKPHSLEQFVSDWELAGDICHQPDLGHLHGFFIGPASWKMSQQLLPLFSQSSIRGFGDIMFPSPWNYIDKVKYEPSFEYPDAPYLEKKNALFWIGSTSEGISVDGEWQGMTRQRFTHLVNNNTANPVTILTHPGSDKKGYKYQVQDGSAPGERLGLQANVHLSDVVRCDDCQAQRKELGGSGAAELIDFQGHWQYRYLFDMDGAGFSGRFHAFLQSHSLPFKTGLFRQWFDSRLTPWRHFVPQDIRLHDFWSTLAYFAGISITQDTSGGPKKVVLMEAHDNEGSYIAEQGREWAQRSLRKEDMEIYFFRLLLEWGRLTDDQRDQLGFQL
ncbi:hypothetical protein BGW36DRAFT_374562 [Talaromyces proteolyticus]|uniref:Glycosyl transferase CAP10 domain-containing protein n=1 Tax=Talaromyces proteolyticus TaxID=1131652 RepID=A0AAD4KTJ0_9EURO|nr:uncharacterized protein BGW36DRAFT_374562 [Talaromyces proteolyticus]KAH8700617.1 hypothetical protein BGW36DRAFT_374562 [Talaromyces proteolyticus]